MLYRFSLVAQKNWDKNGGLFFVVLFLNELKTIKEQMINWFRGSSLGKPSKNLAVLKFRRVGFE